MPQEVPCQYHVTPFGGEPTREMVALPQLTLGADGFGGVPGGVGEQALVVNAADVA